MESIDDYIAEFDNPAHADHVLDQLIVTAEKLAVMPEQGSYPRELVGLGTKEYRQVFCKPYRLIYRVMDADVVVYGVADGRRDMQSLLTRRLLGQ